MANILLLGNGAREHVIAQTLKKNISVSLYSFMKSKNPGIASLSEKVDFGDYSDLISKIGLRLLRSAGMEKFPIRYWAAQSLIIAKKDF